MKQPSILFSSLSGEHPSQGTFIPVAARIAALCGSHHLVGNFFHYRHALSILGYDYNEVFTDGRLHLEPQKWADFGPLNFHPGPPKKTAQEVRRSVSRENMTYYSPDLFLSLRNKVAVKMFHRKRGADFDVIGTEGAQAAMAYVIMTFINPGDEVIITDPGYFFFEPPVLVAGGKIKKFMLRKENGYRIVPQELKRMITGKTKLIIVCDPINPFGTVQTKTELNELLDIAKQKNILLLNNITHAFHTINPRIRQYSISELSQRYPKNVFTVSGVSHGFGLAGVRIGFLGGAPELLRPVFLLKSALTRINMSSLAQRAVLSALDDARYRRQTDTLLRNNFARLRTIVNSHARLSFCIEPSHGYYAAIDTSKIKASAQELTVALLKRRCAVYPPDGLGEVSATSYIRVNFSSPHKKHFDWLRRSLPEAIQEAESGIYRRAVVRFFQSIGTSRALKIAETIQAI